MTNNQTIIEEFGEAVAGTAMVHADLMELEGSTRDRAARNRAHQLRQDLFRSLCAFRALRRKLADTLGVSA